MEGTRKGSGAGRARDHSWDSGSGECLEGGCSTESSGWFSGKMRKVMGWP